MSWATAVAFCHVSDHPRRQVVIRWDGLDRSQAMKSPGQRECRTDSGSRIGWWVPRSVGERGARPPRGPDTRPACAAPKPCEIADLAAATARTAKRSAHRCDKPALHVAPNLQR